MNVERRNLPPGARGPRLGDVPLLSVVVASLGDRPALEACLASLLPQCLAHDAELVVVRAGPDLDLEAAYPSVTFVDTASSANLPVLRAAGMAVADGDVVALTEDDRVAAPDWLDHLLAGYQAGADRAVNWGAYFADYSSYLAVPGGSAPATYRAR